MNESDEIIENLFVLEYLSSEYRAKPIIDDYWYNYLIQLDNFKIIKALLVVENEYCLDMMFNIHLVGECKFNYVHYKD